MAQRSPEQLAAALKALVEGGPGNTVELARRLSLGLVSTASAASELVIRDYAERSVDGVFSVTARGREYYRAGGKLAYRVVSKRDMRKKKLCRDTFRQRAWKAMRLQGRFTVPDVITLASRPNDKLPENNLQNYLRHLTKAGYVVRLPRTAEGSAPTSNGFPVFQVLRDAGEIAPVVSRDGSVIDHNPPIEAQS